MAILEQVVESLNTLITTITPLVLAWIFLSFISKFIKW